ncbi:hypothetical protein, partial [Mailhella sp.]|uniref:hypothetical protein n=1 Tax=Mailhella sp. TaxID=1981029 RepID=UPI004064A11C
MLTKGAIGNLVNRYKAVLAKCNLINTFGSLAVAAALVLGSAGVANADWYPEDGRPAGKNVPNEIGQLSGPVTLDTGNAHAVIFLSDKPEEHECVSGWVATGKHPGHIGANEEYRTVDLNGNTLTINGDNQGIHAESALKITDSKQSGTLNINAKHGLWVHDDANNYNDVDKTCGHYIDVNKINIDTSKNCIEVKNTSRDAYDHNNDNYKYVEPSVDIKANEVFFKSNTGNCIQQYAGSTTINATNITLITNEERVVRSAGGDVFLTAHNLSITSAKAIKAADEYGSGTIDINATGLAQINASLEAEGKSTMKMSISGKDSRLEGAINEVDIEKNYGITFNLNNATWVPTG